MMSHAHNPFWIAAILGLSLLRISHAQGMAEYDLPPLNYSSAPTTNAADRFARDWTASRPADHSPHPLDLLRRVLDYFQIPEASQTLVFSKTSLQLDLIRPDRPRAVYFSDNAYLGFVRNGLFELTVTDPDLGVVFYAVHPQKRSVERSQNCMNCHGGARTDKWPGVFVRSVLVDQDGNMHGDAPTAVIRHDTPLDQRWGGWYVTGLHGKGRHLGNLIASRVGGRATMDSEKGANLQDLSGFFDTSAYLRPDSDIVALLVLEHQCEMHNRLTRAMLRCRKWLQYQRELDRALDRHSGPLPSGTAQRVIDDETERILEYMLFCGEERLPSGGVSGAGDFEEAFRANRKTDSQERSLKDFELKRRLFQYRCSYMIYSDAFESLSPELKRSVYQGLFAILSAEELPEKYAHLRPNERRIIREILLETKPEIAEFLSP